MKTFPYKGIPRAEWSKMKAAKQARTDAPESVGQFIDAPAPNVPHETSVAPRVNSEEPLGDFIPKNLFNGQMQKLSVMGKNGSTTDPIPGFHLCWVTDEGGTGIEINKARLTGYQFVEKDEVLLADHLAGNNDLGTHVSYIVNPSKVPPERGYLMKKPLYIHEAHQAEFAAYNQRIEDALRQGGNRKPEDRQYTAQPGSTLPPIEISSNLYRK